MALAAKGGLSLEAMGAIVQSSPIVSNLIDRKIGSIVAADFAPSFPLKHLDKDLGLMSDTARELGAELPVTRALEALFASAKAGGLGELDCAAVYRQVARMAGLE
jgi:3-hydroxyisobutyrate dehydrogenase-like beta-hydroxyacid dehydrogenase